MSAILLLAAVVAAVAGATSRSAAVLVASLVLMALAASARDDRVPGRSGPPWARAATARLQTMSFAPVLGAGAALAAVAAVSARHDDPGNVAIVLWTTGLGVMVWSGRAPLGAPSVLRRLVVATRWEARDTLLAAALFAVAVALRAYRLGPGLPYVHGDEGEMGVLARAAGDGTLPYFGTAFLDHPTLFHHLQAIALWLPGDDIVGLRLLSVVTGALCAPVLFAVGRLGWGRTAGLTAGGLLAMSHLHVHYSRLALNNIETVLAMCLLVAVAMAAWVLGEIPDGRADERIGVFVVLGLVVGLAQYLYVGARLLVVVAVPVVWLLVRHRRATARHAAVATVTALAAFAPLLGHYLAHPVTFTGRTRGVSVFSDAGIRHELGDDARWPADLPRLVGQQLERNLGFFVGSGDHSGFHLADIAAFDPVTVALVWLGLGVVVASLRRFPAQVVAVWLVSGFVLAGVATIDAPNGPRLVVVIPAVLMAAGVGVHQIVELVLRHTTVQRSHLAVVASVLGVVLLRLNLGAYFDDFDRLQANAAPSDIGVLVHDHRSTHDVYLLGAPRLFVGHGAIRFLGDGGVAVDLASPSDLDAVLADTRARHHDAIVVAIPEQLAALETVAERHPGARIETHLDHADRIAFHSYTVDAS